MAASTFSVITVGSPQPGQVMAQATQIVEAGGPSVLVVNTSTTKTVYLSQDNYVTVADAQAPVITPLGPGGSVTFDGSLNVYAVTAPGVVVNLNLYPSAVNFTASTVVTPLSSGGSQSGTPAFTVPLNSTVTVVNLVDVTAFSSYDLTFGAFVANQNSLGAAMTARIVLTWYDAPGVPCYTEAWEPWVANNTLVNLGTAFPNTWGSGPMHGTLLSVTIQNQGDTAMTVQYFNVFASPRQADKSVWRQDPSGAMGVAPAGSYVFQPAWSTLAMNFSSAENLLAQIDDEAVNASAKWFYPFGMWSGPVWIRYNQSGTFANQSVIISGVGLIGGILQPGAACPGIVAALANTTGLEQEVLVNAPHAPLALVITAPATSPPTFSLIAIAKEGQ